ncbi:hypothetical protein L202_02713 [Cryptococcus amylolentus CBS 6039]|uniref:Protein kinase domain-containing protein n=1 Tax=Cryptococcus amylolentus CBS 6039 TaxID=1295533 RepID=A0A1E3HWC8_9TREE|nr:hypothetical protein L202_02713 [Cryptococcus amylolentus CBS 6039]ODN80475.1 hypothetical protein L202_02713 [Cryptococcus amylolentus CBS 6039]
MDFDIVPYEDIVWGRKLGSGSFGSVYQGSYLGIDIAVKEILPSNEYDVHKYFEREWRIMRECRHPNIVLFLGLCKAPDHDGRVFIVSEFVPCGNLRQCILSSNPFPWRLRLSFATDVARAIAYLHARQCIHRDLKGENLLITSNQRIKVTDFGFARIASRNEEELKRMTYCGTDGYMSPEIINGGDLDLPTDVFSLGIIFIEIMSRHVVDSKHFTRQAPSFVPDPTEVTARASPGCPRAFIDLALACTAEDPADRPKMTEVLSRLRSIELQVLQWMDEPGEHVGSIKLPRREGKRAMPVFDAPQAPETVADPEEDDEEKRAEEEALKRLAEMKVDVDSGQAAVGEQDTAGDVEERWRTARWKEPRSFATYVTAASAFTGHQPLIESTPSSINPLINPSIQNSHSSFNSDAAKSPTQTASVLQPATPFAEETASTMTIKNGGTAAATVAPTSPTSPGAPVGATQDHPHSTLVTHCEGSDPDEEAQEVHSPPIAIPTPQSPRSPSQTRKIVNNNAATHRFTLVDRDPISLAGRKPLASTLTSTFTALLPRKPPSSPGGKAAPVSSKKPTQDFGGISSSKCAVCSKRIGQRPGMQCDDCHVIVHVKCSYSAARNCTSGF